MRLLVGCLVGATACGFGAPDVELRPDAAVDAMAPDAPDELACTPVELRASGSHTCVRRHDGQVLCWGDNRSGQLGTGSLGACEGLPASCTLQPTPVPLPAALPATAIGLGDRTGCAALVGGGAACWGDNGSGELGLGATPQIVEPTAVVGRAGAVAFAGGNKHLCSLQGAGILCAGANAVGELGTGTMTPSTTPVRALVDSPVRYAAGLHHGCAINADAQLFCWGENAHGQTLGQESRTATPTQVMLGAPVAEVAAAARHTCAVEATDERALLCWGDNEAGQLGNGSTDDPGAGEVVRPGLSGIREVRAGTEHTCVRTADDAVLCWGAAPFTLAPQAIDLGGRSARAIAAGSRHDCAILDDRSVVCWGAGTRGELGDGQVTAAPVVTPRVAYTCVE